MNFKRTALGKSAGFPGDYLPEPDQLNKDPRPVSYQDSVMMVARQHKGAMLKSLLNKVGRSFKAIIFVDDKEKNTTHMQEGFADNEVDLTAVRYTRQDAVVADFKRSSKTVEVAKWLLFSSMLNQIF